MTDDPTDRLLERVRTLKEEIPDLRQHHAAAPEFQRWHMNYESALERLRGAGQLNEALNHRSQQIVFEVHNYLGVSPHDAAAAYERGLNEAEVLLGAILEDVPMGPAYPAPKKATGPISKLEIKADRSVVMLGNNLGQVNVKNVELIADVDALIKILQESEIPADQKREAIADAETVKAQLLSPKPKAGILKTAWKGLEAAATTAGAADLATKIGGAIQAVASG